ncbi:MAG: hypothetical protein ACLQPH_07265 [Acidimicrobiales bacterium]
MTVGITELPPEGMQLGGVALAGDADRGTKTTEGLSLLFTTAGITVQGPQPQIERLLVWSGLDAATCREKVDLPDGRSAAVMELTSGGQSIRFLLPTETVTPGQAAYLDQALPAWLQRYRGAAATDGATSGAARGATSTPEPEPEPEPEPGSMSTTSAWSAPAPPDEAPSTGAVAAGASAAPAGPGPAANGSGAAGAAPPPPPAGGPATIPPPPASTPAPPPGPPRAQAAAPPPPPPGPSTGSLPPPPPGASTWETAVDPLPGGTAWDNPPLGQVDTPPAPPRKSRGWRGSGPDAGTADAPVPPPGAPAPPGLPTEPPQRPVPLNLTTLPPPPPDASTPGAGPVVWKPPIDPVTGETLWDEPAARSDTPVGTAPKRKKSRGWRRGTKAATVAAGTGTAAALAGTAEAGAPAPPPVVPGPSGPTPTVVPPPPGGPPAGSPRSDLPPPPADAPATPVGIGSEPPPPLPPPPGEASDLRSTPTPPDEPVAGQGSPAGRRNRPLLLLLVLLIAVIGGIAYFAIHRNGTTTTTTTPTVSPTTAPSPVASDAALAASINLRLTDLPAGWMPSTPASAAVRPPAAPAATQASATQALASCLGTSPATVAGLFGGSVLPGQMDSVRSLTFRSGADPTIQMYSVTTVMSSPAALGAVTAPLADPNLTTCFAQYQQAAAAAAVPGSTAQVQVVVLPTPAGVMTTAYVTTFTIPGQGTEVVGEAFMRAGRTETKLEPSTNGPPVPYDAFTPAYNAVADRLGLAADR